MRTGRVNHLGAIKAGDGNELIANIVAVLSENPTKRYSGNFRNVVSTGLYVHYFARAMLGSS
jgi:hypothetical protein